MKASWPDIFKDESLIEKEHNMVLCAMGIEAWALCLSGNDPPESFGKVLIKIRSRLGMEKAATAENLVKFAKEKGWLK